MLGMSFLFFTKKLEGWRGFNPQFISVLCKTFLSFAMCVYLALWYFFFLHHPPTHTHTPSRPDFCRISFPPSSWPPLSSCLLFSLRRPYVITVKGGPAQICVTLDIKRQRPLQAHGGERCCATKCCCCLVAIPESRNN